jgi:hypothetical protein
MVAVLVAVHCAFVNTTCGDLIGSAADNDPIIFPNTIDGIVAVITVKGNGDRSTSRLVACSQRGAAEGYRDIHNRCIRNIIANDTE